MAKIIKLDTGEEQEKFEVECSICRGNFDVDGEGGLIGSLGILPVHFCPTCLSGIFNMVDFLRGKDEDTFDE